MFACSWYHVAISCAYYLHGIIPGLSSAATGFAPQRIGAITGPYWTRHPIGPMAMTAYMQVSFQFERSSQMAGRCLVNLIVCFLFCFILKTGRFGDSRNGLLLPGCFFLSSIVNVSSSNVAYFMLHRGKLICIKHRLFVSFWRMVCAYATTCVARCLRSLMGDT